jgi:hypothetical protein
MVAPVLRREILAAVVSVPVSVAVAISVAIAIPVAIAVPVPVAIAVAVAVAIAIAIGGSSLFLIVEGGLIPVLLLEVEPIGQVFHNRLLFAVW